MSLFKEAMSDVGVSMEEFQAIPVDGHVEDPILPNVTQEPSSSIPVSQAVTAALPEPVTQAPPEPAPMTPDEVVQVVETVEPIVECAVQEHELLRERAEQLVAIQTAMEQYHNIIRKRGFNGITPESAQILQVHMRIAARQLGTDSKVASMEAFKAKDAREQHDLAEISMEDLRTTAKVAGNVIHKLIEKMISSVKQFAMRIVDGIGPVEHALNGMDKELSQIKFPGGDGEVKINTTMLNVNGTPDLEVGKEVMSLAMFAAKTYPDAVVTFLKGATKAVFKYDPEEDNSDEMKAYFQEAARPLQAAIKAGANDEQLPGGFTMHISESGMSVGISGEDKVLQSHREVKCSTTKELRDATRKLQEIVKIIKEIRPSAERIEQEGHKLLKAVERIRDRAGDDKRWAHEVMDDESRKLVMEATPRSGELIGYLLKYIKAQMVAIKTQAEHIVRLGKTDGGEKESTAKPATEMHGLSDKFRNLAKFISEGKLLETRTALRMEYNNSKITLDELMEAKRLTKKVVPDLFEEYKEAPFADPVAPNPESWDEDTFHMQQVFLKTNFSEKRFDACAKGAKAIGYIQ